MVKIRYSDFNTYTKQLKLPYTSADHVLLPAVLNLFDQLYNKRLLVRLVGVRLSGLVHGSYQIDLFDDSQEMLNLYQSMDHIRDRFGDRSLFRASTLGVRTIERHNPFNGEPPVILAHRKQ